MELLYFISGILSVGITYAILLLRKNQSNYHDALARLQHHQNISSIRSNELSSNVDDLKLWSKEIKNKLEKDQYESVAEINKEVERLRSMTTTINKKLSEGNRVFNKNITDVTSEIQQLKRNIGTLGKDANTIDRY
tara:strand:+ start:1804 stop:2211 length:408 start_codon:yes stop_codon:yes gene_type:complete